MYLSRTKWAQQRYKKFIQLFDMWIRHACRVPVFPSNLQNQISNNLKSPNNNRTQGFLNESFLNCCKRVQIPSRIVKYHFLTVVRVNVFLACVGQVVCTGNRNFRNRSDYGMTSRGTNLSQPYLGSVECLRELWRQSWQIISRNVPGSCESRTQPHRGRTNF